MTDNDISSMYNVTDCSLKVTAGDNFSTELIEGIVIDLLKNIRSSEKLSSECSNNVHLFEEEIMTFKNVIWESRTDMYSKQNIPVSQ